jgi:hypothetical protein
LKEDEEDQKSLKDFLSKYGDRGYYILKALLESSKIIGKAKLGDFDLKDLKDMLNRYGLDYNPVPLIAKLEKEYKIIRTTYRSDSQHWWDIIDKKYLESVINEYEGNSNKEDDPKLRLLKLQFYSLNPENIQNILQKMSQRKKLGQEERNIIKNIAFSELPMIVDFLTKAKSEYEEELLPEISLSEKIIDLAENLVLKANSSRYYGKVDKKENSIGFEPIKD